MRETNFPTEVNEQIKEWLHDQIRVRRRQLEKRHKTLVPEWRRLVEGKPKDENKSWPFENCANLVHQVIGEACDDMAARVMGIIWATAPIAIYRYLQKVKEDSEAAKNTEKAKVLETFMDFVAYEPNELDLYEKENIWFNESTKIGTGWVCVVPEEKIEPVYIGYEEKRGSKFEDATLYEGPKVINLRDDDVLYDPNADTPEDSDFFSRTCRGLTKRKLQERE